MKSTSFDRRISGMEDSTFFLSNTEELDTLETIGLDQIKRTITPDIGYTDARIKVTKILNKWFSFYDKDISYCKKLTQLISLLNKPEQVCQKELDEWKGLIDVFERKASEIIEWQYRAFDYINEDSSHLDPAIKSMVLTGLEIGCQKRSNEFWDFAVFLRASVIQLSPKDKSVKKKRLSSPQDWDNYLEEISA